MGQSILEPENKRTGVFIHGENEDMPCVVGALWIDPSLGVLAEIPYIGFGTEQFATPARWFHEEQAPKNLVFRSEDLRVSLFGSRIIRATTGTHIDVGRIRFREAVFAEGAGDIEDELRVTKLVSHIDGLAKWSGLSSVKWDTEFVAAPGEPRHNRINYVVEPEHGLDWLQGSARMKLVTHWRHEGNSRSGIHLMDDAVLESRFHEPRLVSDHLKEHRKFRALLSLILGSGANFRGHSIRDRRFPYKTLDGTVRNAEYERLVAASTVADHYRPSVESATSDWPILSVNDLSSSDLSWWANEYERSERFVLPTISMLQRSNVFAEDRVINASMSIEALGAVLGQAVGETSTLRAKRKPTTATYFYRVAKAVGVDASPVAESTVELARALANTYNDIKHADRGNFPDGLHVIYAGRLSLILIRMAILQRLSGGRQPVASYASSWPVRRLIEGMKTDGICVQLGKFVTLP